MSTQVLLGSTPNELGAAPAALAIVSDASNELADVRTGDVLATPGPEVRLAVSLDNTCWLDENRHPVCLGEDRYEFIAPSEM